jgi:3-phenylpropionate/cinnamic acid dioxygenase small subunit
LVGFLVLVPKGPSDADLRWLVDQSEIRNLIPRISQLVDTGDLADYAQCFAVDAEWYPPVDRGDDQQPEPKRGRAEIVANAQQRRDAGIQGPDVRTRHFVSTTVVTPDGADRARARSYWRCYHDTTTPTPRLFSLGQYDDEFVRTEDGWQLARRRSTRG